MGLLFIIVGVGNFFVSISGSEEPHYFWCIFVGMPLLFVGIVLCLFGFQGAIARYEAGEIAPVAKDTFNYLAEGTQEGVRTIAAAIGGGLEAGLRGARRSRATVPDAIRSTAPTRSSASTAAWH